MFLDIIDSYKVNVVFASRNNVAISSTDPIATPLKRLSKSNFNFKKENIWLCKTKEGGNLLYFAV